MISYDYFLSRNVSKVALRELQIIMPRASFAARKIRRRPRKAMRGDGIGDWLRKAKAAVKSHKLISTLAPKLLAMHPPTAKYAHQVGALAATAGYGVRRRRAPVRRPRRVRGEGKVGDWFKGAARSVGNFFTKNKVLSTIAGPVLSAIPGLAPYAGVATQGLKLAGLGKRRRAPVRRIRGGAVPIGISAAYAPGTLVAYYPYATNNSRARF